MKKYVSIILIALLTINLSSCATYSTMNTNKWLEYELRPSKIIKNGEVFFGGKLSDGSVFSVFQDDIVETDEYYYYHSLMQDFGWSSDGEKWTGSAYFARRPKVGHIYINPSRHVAIYFYPRGTFNAFKVNITK